MSDLPAFFPGAAGVPERRRPAHNAALAVIQAHERDGSPFALVLRTFGVVQLFTASDAEPGIYFENYLVDRLPMGVKVVEVQTPGDLGDTMFDQSLGSPTISVYAPSLVLADDTWLRAVTYLVERAELIVVVFQMESPGVLAELRAILDSGRHDRTVVLFSELGFTSPASSTLLDRFPRVLSFADLDPRDMLGTFVFPDLVERIARIRDAPAQPLPVQRAGLGEAFEELAIRRRGERSGKAAARYFANAVCIALMDGDLPRAVRLTAARIELLPDEEVDGALSTLESAFGELRTGDPDQSTAHAHLVILRAGSLSDPDAALSLLDEEYARCREQRNRRALSALLTARAWQLRLKRDAVGVLDSGYEALRLAQEEGAKLEMAKALHIIGTTWHELGELSKAGTALGQACDVFPREDGPPGDLWLMLIRLADVLRDAGNPTAAGEVLNGAVRLAEATSLPAEADAARRRVAEFHGRRS